MRAILTLLAFVPLVAAEKMKSKFLDGFPLPFKFTLFWWCAFLFFAIAAYLVDLALVRLRARKVHAWIFQYTFPPETDLKKLWQLLAEPDTWTEDHPTLAGAKLPDVVPKIEAGAVLKLYERDALPDDPEQVIMVQKFLEVEHMKSLRVETESPSYPVKEETSTIRLTVGDSKEIVLDIYTEVVIASRILAKFQGIEKHHITSLTEWCRVLHKMLHER
eukprot:GEMP01071523.1.p1 GENE.GEMP01071523.1~~GEMP01071523.1.p1  ORF type:complete len:241 (+),score=38.81 GEMP01071523.1:72-725(+)